MSLMPPLPDCRLCSRWELAPKNPGVPTIQVGIPGRDALVVVAPSPGYYEHVHNEPAVGKPGRLLREILLAELSTLCTIYLTYLVRCGVDQDSKSKDFKSCFTHHLADIHSIWASPAPQIRVLLLGADATTQFHRLHLGIRVSHKEAIANNGKPRTILSRSVPVFATIHPAAILRNNSLIHTVEDHINLLTAHVKGQAPTPTDPDIQAPRSPHHLP
jgi:uracil-DNA glycosylase family 4